jgi:hypothetical protein
MQRLTQAMGCLQGKHFTKCRETFCDKSAHHVRAAICQRYTSSRSTDMIFPIYYLAPWKYKYIYIYLLVLCQYFHWKYGIYYIYSSLVLCQYDHDAKWARPMAIWGCIPGKTPAMSQNQFRYPIFFTGLMDVYSP